MNIKSLLAIFTIGLITGCSTNSPAPTEQAVVTPTPSPPSSAEKVLADAGESCFRNGTMYSDGAASCQAGLQYRCSNGEWVSLGPTATCSEEAVATSKPCQFADITYPTGAASCQAGTQYRCEDGSWRSLAISCSSTESPIRTTPGGRTCMFDGVTVATNSTVCRTGSTFLCSDGEWINLGTLCR